MKPIRISLLLSCLLVSRSLFHQSENPAPKIITTAHRKNCEMPAWKTFVLERTTTVAHWVSAFNCVEKNIDEAFDKLQGSVPNELNIAELRTLYENKFFDFIELSSEDDWEFLSIALRA